MWYLGLKIITKASEYNRPQKQLEDKDAAIAVLKEELSKLKQELLNQKVTMDEEPMKKLVVANAQINTSISVMKLDYEKTEKKLRKQKEELNKHKADMLKQKSEIDEHKRKFEALQISITEIRTEINRIRVPSVRNSQVYPPQGDMFTTNDYSSHN